MEFYDDRLSNMIWFIIGVGILFLVTTMFIGCI